MDSRILPHELPEPLVVSVDETTRLTDLSRSKIYELLGEGRLEGKMVDNRRLITFRSIKKLLGLDST